MASAPMPNQPSFLRPPSATATAIAARLLTVLLIGFVSIWAHYEASRGFDVAVFNDVPGTPSGRRFHLLFVSDDKATRIILNTSDFVERVLYPGGVSTRSRKRVDRVTLRLVQMKDGKVHVVSPGEKSDEFVIGVDSAIMEEKNPEAAMVAAVQRGMARVWLWDGGELGAPRSFREGMVEYVAALAGLSPSPEPGRFAGRGDDSGGCGTEDDPVSVARFLRFCEERRPGFFARLNRAMERGWDPRLVDRALGVPARRLCSSFRSIPLMSTNATNSDSVAEELSLSQDS